MIENDMKRNGSGYIDETPVKSGVLTGPQPGEIWEDTNGRPFLILKNQDGFCNVLAMRDFAGHDDNIEIINEIGTFYVNPGMVRFLVDRDRGRYIYTIPLEKHLEIMEAVGERLGVTIKVSAAMEVNQPIQADQEEEREAMLAHLDILEARCKELEHQLEESSREVACVADERHALQEELRECREEMVLRRDFREEYEKAESKATQLEKMYNALLDRLFARGEAK